MIGDFVDDCNSSIDVVRPSLINKNEKNTMGERDSFHPANSLVTDERFENLDLHRRLIKMCNVGGYNGSMTTVQLIQRRSKSSR